MYLARHPRLERLVALKVLGDGGPMNAKTRSAFEREAALAARLEHPNIVAVYDRSGPDDAASWLSMRYIDGGDVTGLLTEAPQGLAAERAVRLISDAAHALDFAHGQGVLHRDVKPANLLVEHDARSGERALLTDFGIARSLDDTVTLSGMAASFGYVAPERLSDRLIDHRADLYSLGCTLFQLLTGQPPFPRADQAAVIAAHLTEPPPAPSASRPGLPVALDAVIAKAMAKDPQQRYPNCSAFASDARRNSHCPSRIRGRASTAGCPRTGPGDRGRHARRDRAHDRNRPSRKGTHTRTPAHQPKTTSDRRSHRDPGDSRRRDCRLDRHTTQPSPSPKPASHSHRSRRSGLLGGVQPGR